MATAVAHLEEESLIAEQIAGLTLPKGVRFKRVRQAADWTGDPVLRIQFSVDVSEKYPLTPKRVSTLVAMQREVQAAVFSLRLDKFPFVDLLEAKQR